MILGVTFESGRTEKACCALLETACELRLLTDNGIYIELENTFYPYT